MRKFGHRLALGLSLVMACAPMAIGQTLEKIPFEKRLKLAAVGDEDAQLSVGLAYETGTKAKVSKTEAAKWYRMAADQGNIEARSLHEDRMTRWRFSTSSINDETFFHLTENL